MSWGEVIKADAIFVGAVYEDSSDIRTAVRNSFRHLKKWLTLEQNLRQRLNSYSYN